MSIDPGKTKNGIPTTHLVLAIATTIVGVLAVIGLGAATYITIAGSTDHADSAWAGYAVGLTGTALIAFVVLLTHYLRQRTIARNHERNDERLQAYISRIQDDLRQWVTGAQVEIMSAFGEILTQTQSVMARTRDNQQALSTLTTAVTHLADRQAATEKAIGELAERTGSAIAGLSTRLNQIAVHVGALAETVGELSTAVEAQNTRMDELAQQQQRLADQQAAAEAAQQRRIDELERRLVERQATAQEAQRKRMDELAGRVDQMAAATEAQRQLTTELAVRTADAIAQLNEQTRAAVRELATWMGKQITDLDTRTSEAIADLRERLADQIATAIGEALAQREERLIEWQRALADQAEQVIASTAANRAIDEREREEAATRVAAAEATAAAAQKAVAELSSTLTEIREFAARTVGEKLSAVPDRVNGHGAGDAEVLQMHRSGK